jgi:hypothetical protein
MIGGNVHSDRQSQSWYDQHGGFRLGIVGAFLRSLLVLYPSRHTGFKGTPTLIAFEAVKALALLLIMGWVYVKNAKEDDQVIRSRHLGSFTLAATGSIFIDLSIYLFR